MTLTVLTVGPAVSVQDAGRPGQLGLGLSRGGAADRAGYLAACALANAPLGTACIEMAGFGGRFRVEADTAIALAGAAMRATLDGAPLEWHAGHDVKAGSLLEIGAVEQGVYGYLLPGGGVLTETELGGRGFHRIAGLGHALAAGDVLPFAPVTATAPMRLSPNDPAAGAIRVMPGSQTALFSEEMQARFETTEFTRSAKANRQGVRLDQSGAPFSAGSQLLQVSDFISEGDIQMTGDGTPYVLLADCQTMGGYPRIGTVLPADLGRVAQAMPGETLRFRWVTVDEAEALWQSEEVRLADLKRRLVRRIRDPREMRDLLGYDLIDRPRDVLD